MKITEVVLTAPAKLEQAEFEIKTLNDDDLLIEVLSCGLCSSELPVYLGQVQGVAGSSFRYASYPCFLGHEVTGYICDKGKNINNFAIGDRVTGIAYRRSGFATHVVEPSNLFVKAPTTLPLEYALGEPTAAVVNIIRMSEPEFADNIVIMGDGFMALLTVALLAHYPLRSLIICGHHDNRLVLAKQFGATDTINAKQVDPYWAVRKILDGKKFNPQITPWPGGADIIFDFTGKMQALQTAASLCKPKQRAKLMLASFYDREPFPLGHYLINRAPMPIPCFPSNSLHLKDDLIRSIWSMEAGVAPMQKLITHAFPLSQLAQAFTISQQRSSGYIKGIIVPDSSKLEATSPITYLE